MTESPFKLLEPYRLGESKYFFGRDKEIVQLSDLLTRSKFVLVYGASGTGKTSLIECGLSGMYPPRDWYPIFIRYNGDFIQSIKNSLFKEYQNSQSTPNGEALDKFQATTDLGEKIKLLFTQSYRPIYLILDQFEEIFTLSKDRENEPKVFFETIKNLDLFSNDLYCKIIIACREEYLAHFYDYEKELPFLFENRFRLEKMRDKQMLLCIQKIVAQNYPGFRPILLESGMDQQILTNVKSSKGDVELTELQIYLDRLYREDLVRISNQKLTRENVLFDAELVKAEDLSEVLDAFLDEQLEQVRVKLRTVQHGISPLQLLFKFVTNEGTKRNLSFEEMQEEFNKGVEEYSVHLLQQCLKALLDPKVKLLNRLNLLPQEPERYEIMHDRMAACVSKRLSGVEARFREAQSIFKSRYKRFQEAKENPNPDSPLEYLSKGDLAIIKTSLNLKILDAAEQKFIRESTRYNIRKKVAVFGSIFLGLLIIMGVIGWNLYLNNIEDKIRQFVVKSKFKEDEDPVHALAMLDSAFAFDSIYSLTLEARKELWLNQQFYYKRKNYTSDIFSFAMADDGQHLVIGTDNQLIWTDAQGNKLDSLETFSRVLASRIYKDQGVYFVTRDKKVYFWSLGQKKADRIGTLNSGVFGFDLNPKKDLLAILDAEGNLHLWQHLRPKPSKKILDIGYSGIPHVYPDHTLAFNGSGDRLISAIQTQGAVIFDLQGKIIQEIPSVHRDFVLAVDYSPIENKVLTCSRDGQMHIWDLELKRFPTNQIIFPSASRYSQNDRINLGKFSPNGSSVLVGYTNRIAQIWNLKEGTTKNFLGHQDKVLGVAWKPNSRAFLTASGQDATLLWWKIASRAKQTFGPYPFGVEGLCFVPERNELFIASGTGEKDNDLKVKNAGYVLSYPEAPQFLHRWKIASKRFRVDTQVVQVAGIKRIISINKGKTIVACGAEGILYWWNLTNNDFKNNKTSCGDIYDICTMDSSHFAVVGSDSIEIWNIGGYVSKTLPLPPLRSSINCVAWNGINQRLYLGLNAFDLEESGLYEYSHQWNQVQGYPASVCSIAFSSDGLKIAIGTSNNKIYLGGINNLNTPEVFSFTNYCQDGVEKTYDLAFSPNGKKLALATKGGKCVIINLGLKIEEMILSDLDAQGMFRVVFAPDNKSVYCGGSDGWVYQYTIP